MLDYSDAVDAVFLQRHGECKYISNAQKLNMRYEVAKALLHQKYSHITGALEKKATEQHKVDLNEWNLVLDDISAAQDVAQCVSSLIFGFH